MFLLVNHVKDELQSKLVTKLYKHENFAALLQENPAVVKEV